MNSLSVRFRSVGLQTPKAAGEIDVLVQEVLSHG